MSIIKDVTRNHQPSKQFVAYSYFEGRKLKESTMECASRNLEEVKRKLPKNTLRFGFFYAHETIIDGEKAIDSPESPTGWHYVIGRQHTLNEMVATMPNKFSPSVVEDLRKQGITRFVLIKGRRVFPLNSEDVVMSAAPKPNKIMVSRKRR